MALNAESITLSDGSVTGHEVLDWIGFYNDQRLNEALDDVPPSEYEAEHDRSFIKTDNTP